MDFGPALTDVCSVAVELEPEILNFRVAESLDDVAVELMPSRIGRTNNFSKSALWEGETPTMDKSNREQTSTCSPYDWQISWLSHTWALYLHPRHIKRR
jgi:hypothetical protein